MKYNFQFCEKYVYFLLLLIPFINTKQAHGQNFNEILKVVSSDRAQADMFGSSVAISGDFAIIGAFQESQDVLGNNTLSQAGSAYIFERDNSGNWNQQQKITASDRASGANFGRSVAIFEDVIVIGAHKEDYNTSGSDYKSNAGSAYIFEKDNLGNWSQTQKIVANDRYNDDSFGWSVAVSGTHIIVGAYQEDENVFGLDTKITAGSAYVFEKDNLGSWNQTQKIVASDRAISDYFGFSVSISGNYALIGAYGQDYNAEGTNSTYGAGAAYVFEKDSSGQWSEVQKLVASHRDLNDLFGVAVSISGNTAVVGAHEEDYDSNESNIKFNSGAVYIFTRQTNGSWVLEQKISAEDRNSFDFFGRSVSISGNLLVVGAYQEKEDEEGLNPYGDAGSAYVFEKNTNGLWLAKQKIVASDRASDDYFAYNVAISGEDVLVGAYGESHDVLGANLMYSAGSAYFFKRDIVMSSALKNSNTQIAVYFNSIVEANDNYPEDFIVTDGNGLNFPVLGLTDENPGDKEIILQVNDLSGALNGLTLTYVNNNNSVSNLNGSSLLASDPIGVLVNGAFTSTYTNSGWDNGVPDASMIAIIDADYIAISDLNCYHLTVNSDKSYTLSNGFSTNVTTDLLLENGAAFLENGTLNVNGHTTVSRTVNATSLNNFHLMSSPVSTGNVEESFQGSYVYRYVGESYDNIYSFENGANIINGEGLAVSGNGNSGESRIFTGRLNKEDIDYDLISTDEWHLLGNPYPTQMSLSSFYNANSTLIKPTLYFYNESNGSYDSWNADLSIGSSPAVDLLAIAQGFFAEELTGATAQVSYTSNMRTIGNDVFMKTKSSQNTDYLKLSLNKFETIVLWTPETSREQDIHDAAYLQGTASKGIFSLNNDQMLCVQSVESEFETLRIPLGYYDYEGGENSISISQFPLSTNLDIRLIDHYENTSQLLNDVPYHFTSIGTHEMLNDRFELLLGKRSELGVKEIDIENISVSFVENIKVLSSEEEIEQLVLYNTNGSLIAIEKDINATEFSWGMSVANGLYLLEVYTTKGISHHKVLVK